MIGILCNQKGMALVTALLLSIFGIALVVALYFVSRGYVDVSSSSRQYQAVLDDARNVSRFVIAKLVDGSIECKDAAGNVVTCSPTHNPTSTPSCQPINVDSTLFPDHDVSACYYFTADINGGQKIHAFKVTVSQPSTSIFSEKSEIDFIYMEE